MTIKTVALATTLALITAGAAAAQAPAQPPGPVRSEGGRAEGGRSMGPDPAKMAERKTERLRATLQLRPDQEPALKAFVEATRHDPGERGRRERPGREAMTTPQRLDLARARMAERQAVFERRAEATKRFYAQLSPAQQKAFDALRPHRDQMGGRHRAPGPGGHRG